MNLRFLLTFWIFLVTVYAATPKPFSHLGDAIYTTTQKYEKMARTLPQLQKSVESYLHKIRDVKALGYEAEVDHKMSQSYLKALRALEHERQLILTGVNAALYNAMDNDDTKQFKRIIESGLLKMDKVGDDVLPFYEAHFKKGAIRELDALIAQEKRYKVNARQASVDYSKQVEARRVNRMRKASDAADARREQELDSMVNEERERIHKELESEMIR